MKELAPLLRVLLHHYTLDWGGDHGVAHWARVLENGIRLAEATGADMAVVRHFALFHDAQRLNDWHDPDHGPRAATLAASLRGQAFELSDAAFALLQVACAGHTSERTHPDTTVQTCWDADRLDLGRVGITPDPFWLGTEVARRPETIRWADGRARLGVIPDFVRDDWGIELRNED